MQSTTDNAGCGGLGRALTCTSSGPEQRRRIETADEDAPVAARQPGHPAADRADQLGLTRFHAPPPDLLAVLRRAAVTGMLHRD